jgi:hypothetical protein
MIEGIRRKKTQVYGLMAEFDKPDELITAAKQAHQAGYRKMEGYTPFPVEGLAEAIGIPGTRLQFIILIGGIIGAIAGFGMQYYIAAIDYPLNIGGRPFNSWPAFIPVTFELTVLFAAFAAVLGMLGLNGLPHPYHPVFNEPRFELASNDRFFLCIEAQDPKFDLDETRRFLETLDPIYISEVDQLWSEGREERG